MQAEDQGDLISGKALIYIYIYIYIYVCVCVCVCVCVRVYESAQSVNVQIYQLAQHFLLAMTSVGLASCFIPLIGHLQGM